MFILYTLVSCLPFVFVSEGRTVQGILGRNVSFSWTFNNTKRDTFSISRNSTHLLMVWPLKNLVVWHDKNNRFQVYVEHYNYDTLAVTICISHLREQDAGIYKVERRWDSEDFNDSVILQIYNETALPWITLVQRVSLDSSIQLQCKYLHMFTGKVSWKVNNTVIHSRGRYFQNNARLSIKNVTADDMYNIYTCNELGNGFDSGPYRLNISGPTVVKFVSNVTVAKEHEGLNLFCDADCYPTCTWNWTQLDHVSTARNVISADSKLQIYNVTREDAGKYSCKVYNIFTGASLEGFTYLEVVYGPDEIYINISDNIIQVNEFETVSVFCYADCFPPCQFAWTETNTNTPIRGAELKLESRTVDVNYTCYATNPMNAKTSKSSTIYIKVSPGVSVFTTTTLTAGNNTDFPAIHHLLYFVIGLGVLLAIGLLACLLHKFMACSHVRRSSSNRSLEHSNVYRENEISPAEHHAGNYWTIVSNARGELTTAIDVDNAQCIIQTAPDIKDVLKEKNLEHSIGANVDIELEEYLEPIHSDIVEHDDYIHPVHSGHVEI